MARECLWIRISKGGVLEQTDEVLRDRTTYRPRLEELKAHGNLLGLASDTGAVRSESDRHHAAVEGLGGAKTPGAWWPGVARKDEIVRQGFIRAYEAALADDENIKPISVYWLRVLPEQTSRVRSRRPGRAIGKHEPFEVIVTRTEYQVTLFLVTPVPPSLPVRAGKPEDIWVVASTPHIDRIVRGYADPAEASESAVDLGNGVSVFQVRRGAPSLPRDRSPRGRRGRASATSRSRS